MFTRLIGSENAQSIKNFISETKSQIASKASSCALDVMTGCYYIYYSLKYQIQTPQALPFNATHNQDLENRLTQHKTFVGNLGS